MKKYGKNIIATLSRNLNGNDYQVFILEDFNSSDEKYYNVHVSSVVFVDDELNTLQEQVPYENVKDSKEFFDEKFLIGKLMEFFIWYEFSDFGVISVDVNIVNIDPNE